MDLNWLYGPKYDWSRDNEGADPRAALLFRSVVIDIDTVKEVFDLISARFPSGVVQLYADHHKIEVDDLHQLSGFDRQRVTINLQSTTPEVDRVSVDLADEPIIIIEPFKPEHREFAIRLGDTIMNQGRPRLWLSRYVKLLAFLPWLTLAISWMVYETITKLPIALSLFGAMAVLIAFAPSLQAYRTWGWKYGTRRPGVKVRLESRQETHARRADQHANVKVAVITAAITILATLVTTALTGLLDLG